MQQVCAVWSINLSACDSFPIYLSVLFLWHHVLCLTFNKVVFSRAISRSCVTQCVCAWLEFHEACHSVTFIVLVNSHQRWKQTRNRVCFHLWCELTLALWCHSIVWSPFFMKWDVTEWQVSWNSCTGLHQSSSVAIHQGWEALMHEWFWCLLNHWCHLSRARLFCLCHSVQH